VRGRWFDRSRDYRAPLASHEHASFKLGPASPIYGMIKALAFAGVLVVLAIGGWLSAQQSKTAGPTSSAVRQA
jgi:hypothetical protein